jgi:hypothetical protein
MSKTAKPTPPETFRYEPEDLEPRGQAADDALIDDFIARNKQELLESLDEADKEDERGEGRLLEDVLAEIKSRLYR